MTTKAKIITASIGLVCLAITLIFPNDSTILSVAPVIVTFSAWVFISNSGNIEWVEGIFIALAILATDACFILGMSYNYSDGELVLREGGVFFCEVKYIPVAITLFVAAVSLAVGEIVSTYRLNVAMRNVAVSHTYNELVIETINVME